MDDAKHIPGKLKLYLCENYEKASLAKPTNIWKELKGKTSRCVKKIIKCKMQKFL